MFIDSFSYLSKQQKYFQTNQQEHLQTNQQDDLQTNHQEHLQTKQVISTSDTNQLNSSISKAFENYFDPISSSSPNFQINECNTLDVSKANLTYDKTDSSATISDFTEKLEESGNLCLDLFDGNETGLADKENLTSNCISKLQQNSATSSFSSPLNSNADKSSYKNIYPDVNDTSYYPVSTANNTDDTIEVSNQSIDPEPPILSKKPIDLSKITIPLSGKQFEK